MKMRLIHSVFLLGSFLLAVRSQSLSPCALGCGLQSISAVGCSLDNTTCQCTSKSLPQLSAACLIANCTMADSLAVAKFEAQTCHLPFEDKSKLVLASFITIVTTTGLIVFLRIGSKMIDRTLALEDYVVFLALMIVVGANTIVTIFSFEGFGKHLYSLQNGDLLNVLKYFYIAENIYVPSLGLTKLSILIFYLKIFQHQHWFRIAVYTMISIIILSTAAISLLTIFQCHPVQYFWDKDIRRGTCLDENALAYANSGMSIVQDMIIIVLPIPVVLKLNMDTRRKFGVAFMFAVGGFGCIVSIVRLQSLLVFGTSVDPTWDYVPVTIWTALELGAGMICSSLPALRILAQKIFPNFKLRLLSSRSSGSGAKPISIPLSWRMGGQNRHFIELANIETGTFNTKRNEDAQRLECIENDARSPARNPRSNR